MIESYLRPAFQRILIDPVVSRIERHTRWTPMALTYVAGLFGVLSAILLWLGNPDTAVVMLLLSGYLDAVDGSLARKKNVSSSKGAVLDIVMDRVVEFSIMLGLFSVAPELRGYPVLWMLGSSLICVTSFLVVGVFSEKTGDKSFHYSVGLMERAEAFLFYIIMILRPGWFMPLAWLYTALVLMTAVVRVYQFLRLEENDRSIKS